MISAMLILFKGLNWILVGMSVNLFLNILCYFIIFLLAFIIIFSLLIGRVRLNSLKGRTDLEDKQNELKKELENKISQISFFNKIGESLSSVLSKDKLLRIILEIFIETARTEKESSLGFLLLYHYENDEFVYETGYGIDKTMFTRLNFKSAEEIIAQMIKTEQPLAIDDIRDKIPFFKPEKFNVLGNNISFFAIPLFVEENVMGIVNLFCPLSIYNILKNNPLFLSVVTKEASIALGSAVQFELAILDRLTRLYNREYFQRRIKEEIERARRYKIDLSLIVIDIDHFKQINDTYGHQQGDAVLTSLAKIIKENSRILDICARYGGEEIVVILPETSRHKPVSSEKELEGLSLLEMGGAITKAELLRRAVEAHEFVGPKGSLKITISIGIGTYQREVDKGIDEMELFRRADEQLYRAKNGGRNRVCF